MPEFVVVMVAAVAVVAHRWAVTHFGSAQAALGKNISRSGRLEIVDNADDMSKPAPTQFVTTSGSGYVLLRFEPR